MLERLQLLEDKYEELNQKMVDPDVLGNPAELNKLATRLIPFHAATGWLNYLILILI